MSARINVLPFDVANMIAAGEVVERPANAVKEMVENSMDAGATAITVEIKRGGIGLIRVTDNGCGMEADDVPLSVLRHATSKIKTSDDLDAIFTLGFRGEALAAISSVSHMTIVSRTADSDEGTKLCCDGGEITVFEPCGCPKGTTISAAELFYNVPARRKFLKRDATEAAAVTGVVEKLALARPDISLKYICDGEVRFITPGDGDLYSAAYVIFGREAVSRLRPLDRTDGGIRVHGFICEPDAVRSNRNMEYFFINGRYVRSKTISAALDQAYASRIPRDKFPFCILNVDITHELVDVNVHPAKLEVKFSNERTVFEAVYYAVLGSLNGEGTRPELTIPKRRENVAEAAVSEVPAPDIPPRAPVPDSPPDGPAKLHARPSTSFIGTVKGETETRTSWVDKNQAAAITSPFAQTKSSQIKMTETPEPAAETPAPVPIEEKAAEPAPEIPAVTVTETAAEQASRDVLPAYHIIGEAFNCYIIVELEDRLVYIDKHAAHERIIFDSLTEKLRGGVKNSQTLLFPLTEKVTADEGDVLEVYRDSFEKIGFSYAVDSSAGTVSIDAVPGETGRDGAADMLLSLAGMLTEGAGTIEAAGEEFFIRKLYSVSCKAAIKGGIRYGGNEAEYICEKILRRPANAAESAVKTCPHGRPVAFELKKSSIERQFSRLT